MTRLRTPIPLLILLCLMPIETYAQPVITIAPQAVGGLSSWASTQSSTPLLGTPYFSWRAGAEGSLWGITGDSNLVPTLGIGYDSRTMGGQGAVIGGYQKNYDIRLNYVDIDASIRYHWLQVGVVAGVPIKGNINVTFPGFSPGVENFSNTDMTTTVGIFVAANFSVSEWSTGKINLVTRLDYEMQDPISNGAIFAVTSTDPPEPIGFIPASRGPVFIARLGLSYEFAIWHGTQ